jgi:hypothetical protein
MIPYPSPRISCPGCYNSNFTKLDDRSDKFWLCQHCSVSLQVDRHGLLLDYRLRIEYKNKMYTASFHLYPKVGQPSFSLQYLDFDGWKPPQTILELNFLPTIDAKNFLEKLKVLLLFG